jgi:mannose-6-phosphate isomerase-like protein (cupin superfamily)
MRKFETKRLPENPDAIAPDGARVRLLTALGGGSFAHFELPAGRTSRAVKHRTVEETWYVQSGRGRIWRKSDRQEDIVDLASGDCLTIPLGVAFQYEALDGEALVFIAVTIPPWPGSEEAMFVDGPWRASVDETGA